MPTAVFEEGRFGSDIIPAPEPGRSEDEMVLEALHEPETGPKHTHKVQIEVSIKSGRATVGSKPDGVLTNRYLETMQSAICRIKPDCRVFIYL